MKDFSGPSFSLFFIFLLLVSTLSLVADHNSNRSFQEDNRFSSAGAIPDSTNGSIVASQSSGPTDVERQLQLQQNIQAQDATVRLNGTYQLLWEPDKIHGSVHSVAVYGTIVAVGSGYLYDNEIHVYRWNSSAPRETGLTHVWDIGNGIFKSDILSVVFGDTDRDQLIEVVAASADGRIYVFEQMASDPASPLYYQFQSEPVWVSPAGEIGHRVTSVSIDDLDSDGLQEIIAGSWNKRIYVYEYTERFTSTSVHSHEYALVWNSTGTIAGQVNSIATGDTDGDKFREIVAGASDNRVYVFENKRAAGPSVAYPHADNSYELVWNSTDRISGPVQNVAVSNSSSGFGKIIATSRGHGAYSLTYDNATASQNNYTISPLMRALESWEEDQPYPIDNYVSVRVSGDSTTGIFEPSLSPQGDYAPRCFTQNNSTICIPEPYNSAIVGRPDWRRLTPLSRLTLLNGTAASSGTARIVLDFGKDAELTGSGDSSQDLEIAGIRLSIYNPPTSQNFVISLSQDGSRFVNVTGDVQVHELDRFGFGQGDLIIMRIRVDIDPALTLARWDWFRYIKLETSTEVYVDAITGGYLFRPATDVTSVTITPTGTVLLGTATGAIKVFAPSKLSSTIFKPLPYTQSWDSFRPIPKDKRRFSMNNDIWSISSVESSSLGRSFIVAGTYPDVAFIDVNQTSLEASIVWETTNVFDKWTMSLTLKDADNDGVKEVIVGSFDSNLYIFDHVYGNTYRRAWRSPDLTYAASGQTFWDHAKDIVVDDYDNDGKIELLTLTDTGRLLTFEDTGNNQFTPTVLSGFDPGTMGPVQAIAVGDNLRGDGMKEVLVISPGPTIHILENGLTTSFHPSLPYGYVLLNGNVTALAVGDPDGDGHGEIILGGTEARGFEFVDVFETNGTDSGYRYQGSPDSALNYPSLRILSITLNASDIIVSHTFGINIYGSSPGRTSGTNRYFVKRFITSSASYPGYSPTWNDRLSFGYARGPIPGPNNFVEGWFRSSAPVLQLSNGTYVNMYTERDTTIVPSVCCVGWNQSRIFYRTSQDGYTWSLGRRVTKDSQYNGTQTVCPNPSDLCYWLYYERNPSILVAPDEGVWISYECKFASGHQYIISVDARPSICTTKLGTERAVLDLYKIAYGAISPSLFWNSTGQGALGLTYLNYGNGTDIGKLFLVKSNWQLSGTYKFPRWERPVLQISKVGDSIIAFSQKAVFLSDGSLAVVFDGTSRPANRNLDQLAAVIMHPPPQIIVPPTRIMFMTTAPTNSSSWTDPRLLSTGVFEAAPTIAVLKGNVLAVAYVAPGGTNMTRLEIFITASANNGVTWTSPQELRFDSPSEDAYTPSLYGPTRDTPTGLGPKGGGFYITFHAAQTLPTSPAIYYGWNNLEWWRYSTGPVQSLALGDTDGDGVSEIIAGSDNRIHVLERVQAGESFTYSERWVSQELAGPITEMAIGDINNDGVNEIVVTTAGGNLYTFRWLNPSPS
ncbi:VCBS repeat-containing protein [Candidatus Bathyarchaeota archaeon]|nr:MAG: VCBS repeat-containing protein [Candidatus Bathyarchaeota archaeon]TMI29408.1 MAG: VCBS repeat-containing protein [Candidatus Bathyarchaeota archaeon]